MYNEEEYLTNKIILTISAFGMAYYCLDESVSKECAKNVVKRLQDIGAGVELFNDGMHNVIYAFVPNRGE